MQFPVNTAQFGIFPLVNDTQQSLAFKLAAITASQAGLGGVDWIGDTATHAGAWLVFHAVTDCVITSLNYAPNRGGSVTNVTLKAGDRIFGYIADITLGSGTGELYRAAATP